MTNINPNDDVGKINHIIKKEDKVNKKEKPVAETKQVEASSLDALNSYGKANVTFKGKSKDKKEKLKTIKTELGEVISYSKMLALLTLKLSNFNIPADLRSSIISIANTPEKKLIAYKILSDSKLYENESIQKNIEPILNYVRDDEEANAKIQIIDKYLSDPILYENENIQQKIGNIIQQAFSEERSKTRIQIIDKYLSEPKLHKNENLSKCIGSVIHEARNEYSLQIANKYLSDPKLYENENLSKHIGSVLNSVRNEYSQQVANKYLSDPKLYDNANIPDYLINIINITTDEYNLGIANKILSDPQLYGNKNLKDTITIIMYSVKHKYSLEVANKFLSDHKLYGNEKLQEKIGTIIEKTHYEENAKAKIQIIDKYLSEPKLYENKNIQENIGNIIEETDYEESLKAKIQSIDKYLSEPKLYQNKEIQDNIGLFFATINSAEGYEYAQKLFNDIINNEISGEVVTALIKTYGKIEPKKIKQLERVISTNAFKEISQNTDNLILAANFAGLYNKENINEIPLVEKRDILRCIVKNNVNLFNVSDMLKQYFPLIPKNQEEYCTLLPALVKSLGIETNEISTKQEENFDNATNVLSSSLAKLSDEEFNDLSITQEYSKDEFIQDTLSIVKDMPKEERQKVYDYFGFELHHNRKAPTGFSIAGYPVNLNNGKKLAQIEDEKTKQIVEKLRPYVIKFSENNKISCENKEIETALNEIVNTLPELRTTIGRNQFGAHKFDVLKHSLKLMQKTVQNPKFEQLNDSDKKIMMLSALLHDITKAEIKADPMHNFESSFDAFYISKKFNLSQEERIKLYTLINHHEWLKHLNKENISEDERTKRIQSVAFDFQNDNLFELSKIFTEADLKAITQDDSLFDKFTPALNKYSILVEEKITELKNTQPLLPTTKLPKASDIRSRITTINKDYSTNIKGVYLKDDLVVIKYNEVEDWEAVGLPKGSISKGIKTINPVDKKKIDTGNIKFIAHGLDYSNQLINFDAFALPDSDALLSVSYMERPESKYRLFRTQGVLLDVDSKYIYGGGETDSGSGYSKNLEEFKMKYAYKGSTRHKDRKYISDLIKETLNLTDEEYIEFVNKNKNKSMLEIEPKEVREALIKQFALINSNTRLGNREYNEMYVSNPKVQGVFAYSANDSVGKISSFMEKQQVFLKEYAKDNDVPFVVFGD